jgi:hypothetical protein
MPRSMKEMLGAARIEPATVGFAIQRRPSTSQLLYSVRPPLTLYAMLPSVPTTPSS